MHRTLPVSATLCLAVLAGGCKAKAARETAAVAAAREAIAAAEATRAPLAEATGEAPASGQLTISDAEIDSYLEWWQTDGEFVRKHLSEMNELQERLNRKYSTPDLNKIQSDPELLAMMERQREERLEHHRNKPIPADKAAGFDSVLAGLGGSGNHGGRMVYVIHHDERSLSGARGRYGAAFVDKVLSRENDIAAALTP